MSLASAAQRLPPAVTNPAKLVSATVAKMQQFKLRALVSTRIVGGASWSPDGKRVVFVSNISGRNNLWTISAAGGWPTQLTLSNQRQASPAWSPDGRWIAYQSDRHGNQLWDIYLVSPFTGEVTDLSAIPDSAEISPAWSPDSKYVAYMVKAKSMVKANSSSGYEIQYIDIATRMPTRVTRNTPAGIDNVSPLWSPDGKFIAYTREKIGGDDSDVFLYSVAARTATNLTPHTGHQSFRAAAFSPDGKALLITTDAAHNHQSGGFDNVALLDIANRKLTWITTRRREMKAGGFSADGKRVCWTVNVDGRQAMECRAVAGGPIARLPLPEGVNGFGASPMAWSRGGKLLYTHSDATSPKELYVFDPSTGASTQLTHSLVAGVSAASMVHPTLVHYPGKDGNRTVSAWVYVPNNIIRNGKYPAIILLHGGPRSQATDSFHRFIQYMNNQGYLIIVQNYRGNTDYGAAFRESGRHDAGGRDLDDMVAAADFLRRSGFVDPRKLIVMGSGFGGSLTLMAVARHPEMWAAGVAISPSVSRITGPPIHFVDKIKAPLLFLSGANDPRCPPSEARQMAAAVKKHGGIAELKIYADEGHGFSRLENRIDAYQRVADFLRVHAPSPGCGCGI